MRKARDRSKRKLTSDLPQQDIVRKRRCEPNLAKHMAFFARWEAAHGVSAQIQGGIVSARVDHTACDALGMRVRTV
jgi:hypothetical protein